MRIAVFLISATILLLGVEAQSEASASATARSNGGASNIWGPPDPGSSGFHYNQNPWASYYQRGGWYGPSYGQSAYGQGYYQNPWYQQSGYDHYYRQQSPWWSDYRGGYGAGGGMGGQSPWWLPPGSSYPSGGGAGMGGGFGMGAPGGGSTGSASASATAKGG